MSEISALFCGECRDGLDQMESGLLALGRGEINADTINRIFRAAHSIKGGGATFGFPQLSELAHVMETLLSSIRDGTRPVVGEDVQLLLEGADCLRSMLDSIDANQEIDTTNSLRLAEQLNLAIAAVPQATSDATANPVAATITAEVGAQAAVMATVKAKTKRKKSIKNETTTETITPAETIEPAEAEFPAGAETPDPLRKGFVTPATSMSQSIRVDIDKIDRLINLVGELLITQSTLNRFQRALTGPGGDEFSAGLTQLERNTRELQESVLSVRMLPIHVLFSRLPRLVRDLSRRLGKNVELVMSGEATEVDKTILERLGDPLAHLVRNALDHGVETPEVRRNAGKAETARIALRASQTGGRVVIEIEDDGAGLNAAKIRNTAIRAGLISAQDHRSDQELNELIFHPGFSTAEAVSDISGRGVGMDVVKQGLLALSGSIELHSTPGKGTSFVISLPLTLAIIDGQLIRCGDGIYVLPLSTITELVETSASTIKTLSGGGEAFLQRQQFVPVLRLREAFGLEIDYAAPTILVIVELHGQHYAIAVDEVLEQQQIVVKNLDAHYKAVPGLSGATILGDGRLALIIDVGGLVRARTTGDSLTAANIAA